MNLLCFQRLQFFLQGRELRGALSNLLAQLIHLFLVVSRQEQPIDYIRNDFSGRT
jgi:hypothetical protein